MLRAFTAASIIAMSITAARAAPVMDVKYSDLNFSNPSDARVLQDRIHQAATKACAPLLNTSFTSLDYRTWYDGCMRATRTDTTKWVEARVPQYRAFAEK